MTEQRLAGGNMTEQVVRVGDTVRRTPHKNSEFVAKLLLHLAARGFDAAPRYLGRDEGHREVFTFIEGATSDHPSQRQEGAYAEGALMLHRLHELTRGTPLAGDAECVEHGDPGPFNTIFRHGMPVALIDWDAAHPGKRLHDLAYLAWTWCVQSEGAVPVGDQCRRLAEVHRAYPLGTRRELVDAMLARQREVATWARAKLETRKDPRRLAHAERALRWACDCHAVLERHRTAFLHAC